PARPGPAAPARPRPSPAGPGGAPAWPRGPPPPDAARTSRRRAPPPARRPAAAARPPDGPGAACRPGRPPRERPPSARPVAPLPHPLQCPYEQHYGEVRRLAIVNVPAVPDRSEATYGAPILDKH